jgi:hypothetical protein
MHNRLEPCCCRSLSASSSNRVVFPFLTGPKMP